MSTVCVHGLGYIGLPTAAVLANHDHSVVGYDTSPDITDSLKAGKVEIEEPGLRAFVGQARKSGNLEVSENIVTAEYHIICVPTPITDDDRANLSYVEAAGETIADVLRPGDTVVLESTVTPGTTVEILGPILEASGLMMGKEFHLVHCPETVLPGNVIHELTANDRLIGGVGEDSYASALELYRTFVKGDIYQTDATTAEFTKLIQNTYRDVNIALANEIARLSHEYGIDGREAIQLANKHPRVNILSAGPGVGGHCLPVDPYFLLAEGIDSSLIESARRINDGMVDYVIEMIAEKAEGLSELSVAILGITYKGNVSDTRNSPGLRLANEISDQSIDGRDVDVRLYDPHVVADHLKLKSLEDALTDADVAVLMTNHDEFAELNPETVGSYLRHRIVVDTMGMLDESEWSSAGFNVTRI